MTCDPSPYLKIASDLFHFEMDQCTSGCFYGSAATNDWVGARSDLDLLVLVPEERLELFGDKIKSWQMGLSYPLLDGFVLYFSKDVLMAKRFDTFESRGVPVFDRILVPDQWKIKYQSRDLFGDVHLDTYFPEVSQTDLRNWAIQNKADYWIPNISDSLLQIKATSPYTKVPLTTLIWVVSGTARILMLENGYSCISKQAALKWLRDRHAEIRENVDLLRKEYAERDNEAETLSANQAVGLFEFCVGLLRE